MVELKTKITESGVLYIPKNLREAFTRNIRIIPNATAAVFFPDHADYEDVLASLKIITAGVEHRIAMKEKEKQKADHNLESSRAVESDISPKEDCR